MKRTKPNSARVRKTLVEDFNNFEESPQSAKVRSRHQAIIEC